MDNYAPVSLETFLSELDQISSVLRNTVNSFQGNKDISIYVRATRGEWHINGLIYHCHNIIKYYCEFAYNVDLRVQSFKDNKPDVLLMYSPYLQNLMFEFYALINLAKITLDNLSKIVYPLFETKHLPKSITDYKSGTTNCPMYERLSNDYVTSYLIDIRNCLVHYRSFATSDNAYVTKEGSSIHEYISEYDEQKRFDEITIPMAKAFYRIDTGNNTVVNIYLPDEIFEMNESGNKKLIDFTYNKQKNLIGFCMRFLRISFLSTLEALLYYSNPSFKFVFNKNGVGEKVEYDEFIQ